MEIIVITCVSQCVELVVGAQLLPQLVGTSKCGKIGGSEAWDVYFLVLLASGCAYEGHLLLSSPAAVHQQL